MRGPGRTGEEEAVEVAVGKHVDVVVAAAAPVLKNQG